MLSIMCRGQPMHCVLTVLSNHMSSASYFAVCTDDRLYLSRWHRRWGMSGRQEAMPVPWTWGRKTTTWKPMMMA